MDKKEALQILYKCARSYEKNLKGYNVLIIFEDKRSLTIEKSINFIETIYYPHNFLHLTGIDYKPKNYENMSKYQLAMSFYNRLLNRTLSYKDIEFKNPYTTKLKLEILHQLVRIDKSAKFIGKYNNAIQDKLYTEKVVGNVSYCFGFVKDSKNKYFYLPNSTIKEKIKSITYNTSNIIAIFKKPRNERYYANITYLKNDIDLNCLLRNNTLANRIDFEHIRFDNSDNIKNTDKVNRFRLELREIVRKFEEKMLGYSNIQADENETSIEPDIDDEYNNIDLDI